MKNNILKIAKLITILFSLAIMNIVLAQTPFTDVKTDKEYSKAVDWAYNEGIIDGTTSKTFSPMELTNREKMVLFIYNAYGDGKTNSTCTSEFEDVNNESSSDKIYCSAIEWAKKNGITSGESSTKFGMGDVTTLAQAVTFLYRANGTPSTSGYSMKKYTTISSSAYYYDAMLWATNNNILNNVSSVTGDSTDINIPINRADAINLLYNAYSIRKTTSTSTTSSTASTTTSSSVQIDQDTIDLFAAGIAMESGAYKGGFLSQLLTGAVMVNNMYTSISRTNGPIKDSSVDYITYQDVVNMFSYCPVYCNSYGSKYAFIAAYGSGYDYMKGKGYSDEQIKMARAAATAVLTREFTIPQTVFGQGCVADWTGTDYGVWGQAWTGVGNYVVTYAYLNNTGLDKTKDVYGNTVSTTFSDYQPKADAIYKKYME